MLDLTLSLWFLQNSLGNLLLFNPLGKSAQDKIVEEMWERTVSAGEILIQEGEVGLAASELYVVKTGKFEVGLATGYIAKVKGAQFWGEHRTAAVLEK